MRLKLSNGVDYIEEEGILRFPNSAVAVCVSDDGHLLLVRQFRQLHQRETLEIPGGRQEGNESEIENAARELLEEAGVRGTRPELIASVDLDFSASAHVTHVVKFHAVEEGCEDGRFETVSVSLKRAMQMIAEGEITHAPTIIAITWEVLGWKA
ncbi:NUDIX hydrolase [Aquicoccus porphyridii]|uniref:NUDIX hydrolase n=1 Tax=Aquicoccus porphyridii TaxID=1852029 RepID=A0A5A9ZCD3_9RHOB|nr:NUDIX hydrolase [Aquicoccus porphyridii]KAA0914887.1 NUDIX hydrolase [Aquicoccus porphyridii]RAI52568.1 hypothetical protein DOO74_17285 [Rhodobacteraceae bacterium AsT-22]